MVDGSFFSAIAMRPMIEAIILTKLPITEGSTIFANWKTPPVSPVMYFRAFNLTNEEAFLRGKEVHLSKESIISFSNVSYL